jgi:hypothetical protein
MKGFNMNPERRTGSNILGGLSKGTLSVSDKIQLMAYLHERLSEVIVKRKALLFSKEGR